MRIAITGGICEGKSTVLEFLREAGWSVCSSDALARELFSDAEVNQEVGRIAGLSEPIQPGALREAMLDSAVVRRAVNRFLHPLIGERSRVSNAVFFEVPLLIEACLQSSYDRVWVVICGAEEQRRRLLERYKDPTLVERLLMTQLNSRVRVPFADRIIRTNQTPEAVRTSLHEATHALNR